MYRHFKIQFYVFKTFWNGWFFHSTFIQSNIPVYANPNKPWYSWLETAGGATDRWNQYPISVLSLDW